MLVQGTTTLSLALLLSPLLAAGQPLSGTQESVRIGAQPAGNVAGSSPVRYHLLASGAVAEGAILPSLMKSIEETRPANADEVQALLKSMKIDGGMPNRIRMNVGVPKQTQGATFGERVNAGPPRTGAGGGAASAAYAATGRAPEEIVILLCDDVEQEHEALRLIPAQLEEARAAGERASPKIQDEARSFTSLVRQIGTPGGRPWSWLSGNVLP